LNCGLSCLGDFLIHNILCGRVAFHAFYLAGARLGRMPGLGCA
jgi:hypothetical protein